MQAEYIKTGYTEIHRSKLGQIDNAELVVEDADNSDNPGEHEIVALVVRDRDSGDGLATVQLTKDGTHKLYEALEKRLGMTYL